MMFRPPPVPPFPDPASVLLTPAEMGEADRLAIAAGTSGLHLMERAGIAVADACTARFGPGARAVVVCGPGNNGGDGFVVARKLAERGFVVRLVLVGDRAALSGDAAAMAARWHGDCLAPDPSHFAEAAVVVDALYGAGLRREVTGVAAETVAAINAAGRAGACVIAVDLPSGIDGETGAVRGIAVEADRSVTFFRKKPGHLLLPGRAHCGKVEVAEIGIDDKVLATIRPALCENGPALWRGLLPEPSPFDHKYARGAVLVYGGGLASSGAARLAAAAALRIGAGLVAVSAPPEAMPVVATYLAALIVRRRESPADWKTALADPRLKAAVIGPGAGLGADLGAAVQAALDRPDLPLVLDADAITLLAEDPGEAFRRCRDRPAPVVLTPHEGEFRRLFPDLAAPSRLERARAAARRSGAILVYKGGDSVIAAPDGSAAIEAGAPAYLATAGSGDVLAGAIAGLMAQGMAGLPSALAGVHLHGIAGQLGGRGLVADDLPSLLAQALGLAAE